MTTESTSERSIASDPDDRGDDGPGWIRWDCPKCNRTNDARAARIAALRDVVGADGLRFVCSHPRCDAIAGLDEVAGSLEAAGEHRDPWTGGDR